MEFRKTEPDYMPPKVGALRKKPASFAFIILGVIIALFIIFFTWAGFSEIDVVTRGIGQVIPSQKTQIISHLEGGIIEKVFVKEGDIVESGQLLVEINTVIAESKYKTNREQYMRHLATSTRLKAQITGSEFQLPTVIKESYPGVAKEEIARYFERVQQVETRKEIAEKEILQKQNAVAEDQALIAQLKEQLSLAEQELTMVTPLAKEELISKRELLRLKRNIANLKGELAKSNATLSKDIAALEQAKAQLAQVIYDFTNEDEEQLREVKIRLAEEQGELRESKDRLERTEIRAPMKGIVKEVKLKTKGSAIQTGEEIMTIVPYEDTLLVEAKIEPRDVAFTHEGQEATVKITAYDYLIYGSLKGKVLKISADTLYEPEKKQPYYVVLIQTDKNYLMHEGEKLSIMPGMTAETDILTGDRTVLSYLLKPILRGLSTTFRER